MALNTAQKEAVIKVLHAISEVIVTAAQGAGPLGVPSGHVYAQLSAADVTLDLYNEVVAILVQEKKVELRGHCIHFLGGL